MVQYQERSQIAQVHGSDRASHACSGALWNDVALVEGGEMDTDLGCFDSKHLLYNISRHDVKGHLR